MVAKKASKPTQKVQDTPAASFDWDSLPAAEVVTYERASVTVVDREASTPAPIKDRVNAAYDATVKARETRYFTQTTSGQAASEMFLKLAALYGKSKGYTVRGKVTTDSEINNLVQRQKLPATTKSGTVLTYSVKPAETRVRLQDSAKATIVKSLRSNATKANVEALAKANGVSTASVRKLAKDNGITLPDARKKA